MIARLIEYCATHRAIVFVGTAFAVVLSLAALRRVPHDAIPDLSDPHSSSPSQRLREPRWVCGGIPSPPSPTPSR